MAESVKVFSSLREEADFWNEEAKKYKKSYETALLELSDYQSSSQELEAELEIQLTQSETKIKELSALNSRVQTELEEIREKYEKLQRTSHQQLSDLESRLVTAEEYKETLRKYVRELEQTNDDLERANRAALASIDDFEYKLNQAIERNVFLETELDEKETMFFADVQHLKEEARDLRQELAVRAKKEEKSNVDESDVHSHRSRQMISTLTSFNFHDMPDKPVVTPSPEITKPLNLKRQASLKNTQCDKENKEVSSPMSSSEPISDHDESKKLVIDMNDTVKRAALTMVGDMLKRIGLMEDKLSSCRPGRKKDTCSPKTCSNPNDASKTGLRQSGYMQVTA